MHSAVVVRVGVGVVRGAVVGGEQAWDHLRHHALDLLGREGRVLKPSRPWKTARRCAPTGRRPITPAPALPGGEQVCGAGERSAGWISPAPPPLPTSVSPSVLDAAHAAFPAFGGNITGRQVELVPGVRIVQAWRASGWADGVYSVARFEFEADDSGTRLVFNHTGYPDGQGEHLAAGWDANYWDPLARHLSAGEHEG